MKSQEEKQWEEEINQMYLANPEGAQQVIEYRWKDRADYFLRYFSDNTSRGKAGILLLDVGCGSGMASAEFSKHGFKVFGVDFSCQAIKLAKKLHSGIDFRQSSIYHFPFGDEIFDVVVCLGVMQTVTDPEGAVQEMSRVLKKGGTLAVKTLNSHSLYYLKSKKDNPSYNFYDPREFAKMLERNNLSVSAIKGIYFFPKPFEFLNRLIFRTRLYSIFNLAFFPFFCLLSNNFYLEAEKQ